MSVDVERAQLIRDDIRNKIHERVKQDAWTRFHKTLFFPEHYYEVATELADPILNTVWMVVKEQICLQVKEDLS
jgi:hypothetical protein